MVRFQNKKEKWVAFVGLLNGHPYEIFTGLMDDEEGMVIGVKGDEDDEAYVSVTSRKDPDFCIVIEHGIWYTA